MRCRFFHENGRENRNNGNQEKGKEEKEALSSSVRKKQKGTPQASPKFLYGFFFLSRNRAL
jgi:hypothetical protein